MTTFSLTPTSTFDNSTATPNNSFVWASVLNDGGLSTVVMINLAITILALLVFMATRAKRPGAANVVIAPDSSDILQTRERLSSSSSANDTVVSRSNSTNSLDQKNTTANNDSNNEDQQLTTTSSAAPTSPSSSNRNSVSRVSSSDMRISKLDALKSSRTVLLSNRDDIIDYHASYSFLPKSQPSFKDDKDFSSFFKWPLALWRVEAKG